MRNIEGKVKILRKFGQYDQRLDKITESLNLRLGLCYVHPPSIRFRLSEHGGTFDILWDNPAAMNEFDPKEPDSIHISEITEKSDLLDKIMRKYRLEIKTTRARKLYQARIRALKIINFLFKEVGDIYIVLQGSKWGLRRGIKYLTYNLKGPKFHSHLTEIKYPYEEDEEEDFVYLRILFQHRSSKIKLNSLLKKMIYSSFGAGFFGEVYFVSMNNPNIIINVYDSRGMDVAAPISIIKKLQEEFNPWVMEVIGLQ